MAIFKATTFTGVFIVDELESTDSRGSFSKLFDQSFFENQEIDLSIKQVNLSKNTLAGTVRGFHYQIGEQAEFKIISCIRGGIFDVLLDTRKDSSTYGEVLNFNLTENDSKALFIPPGIAHAYQTLLNNSDVHYLHTADYLPKQSRGFHPINNDLDFNWPLQVSIISPQDNALLRFVKGK